jgi:thiol-disulfide isomerase/thioredoxin
MKDFLKILIPFVVIACLLVLVFKIRSQLKQKKEIATTTASLPLFEYTTLAGIKSRNNTDSQKTKLLFFFNTDCEHCQAEAQLLAENSKSLELAEVYFLSNEDLSVIQNFSDKYFKNTPSFTVAKVDVGVSVKVFGVNTYPYVFIYSRDNQLLKTFKGEVKLEALTQYVKP